MRDTTTGLVRNTANGAGFTADAQSRWILALGVDRFVENFIRTPGMSDQQAAEAYARYLDTVVATFGVDVDYRGRQVSLFDLADIQIARAGRTDVTDERNRRIGFPEVTSELVGVFKESSRYFTRVGLTAQADAQNERARFYRTQLESMIGFGRSLPQSNRVGLGVQSGFNYPVALGDRSVASIAQYAISVIAGDNMMTPQIERIGMTGEVTTPRANIADFRSVLANSGVVRNDPFGLGHFGAPRASGRQHAGVDVAAPIDADILAPFNGRVVTAGRQNGYGLVVELEVRLDARTTATVFYAH